MTDQPKSAQDRARDGLEARFWFYVDKSGECWVWTGPKRRRGYGCFNIGPKANAAHRWIFMHLNGELPKDIFVCHHCDNPSCVRPDHLFAGTNADNMRDCVQKGRSIMNSHHPKRPRGETAARVKLSAADVAKIRAIGRTMTYAAIGKMFGVCDSYPWRIINGKNWAHTIEQKA